MERPLELLVISIVDRLKSRPRVDLLLRRGFASSRQQALELGAHARPDLVGRLLREGHAEELIERDIGRLRTISTTRFSSVNVFPVPADASMTE